jgi:pSer/pThr/pTyr-binding forkhead associated (FHA) protein
MTDRAATPEPNHTGHRLVLLKQGVPEKVFAITARELVLGRDPACGVALNDPSASTRHARVFLKEGRAVMEDLRSTNGTYLNEQTAASCALLPGDLLRIGHSLFLCLVDGMPLKRQDEKPQWLLESKGPSGLVIGIGKLPILFGRAPEADLQSASGKCPPFFGQISLTPDAPQFIQVACEIPKCVKLHGNLVIKFRSEQFRCRSLKEETAAPASPQSPAPPPKPAADAAKRTVGRPEWSFHSAILPDWNGTGAARNDASLFRALTKQAKQADQLRREPRSDPVGFAIRPGERGAAVLSLTLTACTGPASGKNFKIGGKPILFGRDPASTVQLDAPDVSRRHAQIRRHEGDLIIEDLESANGTRLNGIAIRRSPLKAGDIISIGASEFKVQV